MEFSFVGHIFSILQVVALVCFQRNVSGEIAQGCVGSRLSLNCPEMKVIQITAVVLGDSNCLGASCCIKDSDCTHNANANHGTNVHHSCDNKQSCSVDVLKEKIPCGTMRRSSDNDFERITYNCRDDPQIYATSAIQVIVIACVVCLIVIIAIVASVSVVMVRRKKRQQVKSSDVVKTSDIETDRNETANMNDARGTSLNENAGSTVPIYSCVSSTEVQKSLNNGAKNLETPASDYCELLQCEREYLQLYEPLIVYKQPLSISTV